MRINEYEKIESSKIGDKLLILYKDENNSFCLFLGGPIKNDKEVVDRRERETKSYFYNQEESLSVQLDGEIEAIKYFGENIVFKNDKNYDDLFFKDFFNSISQGLEKRYWSRLFESLEAISDFFAGTSLFDEQVAKMRGYIGELCFVQFLLDKKEPGTGKLEVELAKKVFSGFQRRENEKHDFKLSPKLRFEVKSTQNESLDFIIKNSQLKTEKK